MCIYNSAWPWPVWAGVAAISASVCNHSSPEKCLLVNWLLAGFSVAPGVPPIVLVLRLHCHTHTPLGPYSGAETQGEGRGAMGLDRGGPWRPFLARQPQKPTSAARGHQMPEINQSPEGQMCFPVHINMFLVLFSNSPRRETPKTVI
jgi:hypothetical protein